MLFKCKMCGGDLEVLAGTAVAECIYCGTKQTVPQSMDENLKNLFNRANLLRIKGEFDKAEAIYEKIVQADSTQSEAYWGLILCRYGIEYVDDPVTFQKIPTCHRASYASVIADEDYKAALEKADPSRRAIYEQQAAEIDRIQREILALAQRQETYDVFICYKETDAEGHRTQDSVLANEIYYQLTQEGFKVFYAAITLEGKLGEAYEPIIFAALNSAKVMLAIGTKPEYFSAVWVRNEWSRYLKIMRKDRSKLLIPCYREMDPYELPEEFAHLQAQDMAKLGFINDLVRGIKKVMGKEAAAQTAVRAEMPTANGAVNIAPLLKRIHLFLEDGDWNRADEFCEQVLNQDPECAEAYLCKLMAELRVHNQEELQDCKEPFDGSNNYQKAFRFGDKALKTMLVECVTHIVKRNEEERQEQAYKEACYVLHTASTEAEFRHVAQLFGRLGSYKDSEARRQDCYEQAERLHEELLEQTYKDACSAMQNASTEAEFRHAAQKFGHLGSYKDSEARRQDCYEQAYKDACSAMQNASTKAEFRHAAQMFGHLGSYKDSEARRQECDVLYQDNILKRGISEMGRQTAAGYEDAIALFELVAGWKNADQLAQECRTKIDAMMAEAERRAKRTRKITIVSLLACVVFVLVLLLLWSFVIAPELKHNEAVALMEEGDYTGAIAIFEELDDREMIEECQAAVLKNATVGDTVYFGSYEQDDDLSNGKEAIEWLVLKKKDGKALVISKYALDCKQYNMSHNEVAWENCTLHSWLNNDFINAAFSADEKAMIPAVTVSADKNPDYSTNPGKATQDQVFLLSITEANKYFSSDSARQCEPTDYAVANGAWEDVRGNGWWWLRSPGFDQTHAAKVYSDGDVAEGGYDVNAERNAVRPAMWIEFE